MNRRSVRMTGVALASALGCAGFAHGQASVGTSAVQGRSVNARTPVIPGTNEVAPAPGQAENLRTAGAIVEPVGPTEREIAITQSVMGAIEASHLAAIASSAGASVSDAPDRPAAGNALGDDLRGTSDRAFLDTRRRIAAFAADPGQDVDAGIARTRTSARYGYLAGRYINTLAALHGKVTEQADAVADQQDRPTPARLVTSAEDRLRIALINDSLRKVLTGRSLRRDLNAIAAPSGSTQDLIAQARAMETEGRQMLMKLATDAPAVPAAGSATPDTPDTPATRPTATASVGRPVGDDPALGTSGRPTAAQLARIGLELVDAIPSAAGIDAEIRGQRLPTGPASGDRDVPPAIAPGGSIPRF